MRLLRAAKVGFLGAVALMGAAVIANIWCGVTGRVGAVSVSLNRGCVSASQIRKDLSRSDRAPLEVWALERPLGPALDQWEFRGVTRTMFGGVIYRWSFCLSLWIPMLACVTGAGALHWHERRRRGRPGLCPDCGYDVRGLREGCPECGRGRTERTAAQEHRRAST